METKIIQLSAGNGPQECAFVVAKVLKLFLKELANSKIEYVILYKENGIENGTVQSVSVQLKGKHLTDFLKDWVGTIQWVGTSTFRKYHKRKNWFIGCFEINSTTSVKFHENEIQFQAIRSSGAGGQHVNKVSSAVRAKHSKTGLQVLVMDSRSQHQNKKIAIKRLQEKVLNFNLEQCKKQQENRWMNHKILERGNAIRIFTGTDFKPKKKLKTFKASRQALKNSLKEQINN